MAVLRTRLASVIAILLLILSLPGCSGGFAARQALTEANTLPSGIYHIEITGNNGLALLAYQSEILDINGCAQWDGLASIGAYGLAFQQECHSVYSEQVRAKLWRGQWVTSTATSPRLQLLQWLQECRKSGIFDPVAVPAASVLPLDGNNRQVVSLQLQNASIDWTTLCDAHIDSAFGTQAFLLDIETCSANLYFDAETFLLLGVVFTAQNGQTTISGNITLSAVDGQSLQEFPTPEAISEGTLYEEWDIITP